MVILELSGKYRGKCIAKETFYHLLINHVTEQSGSCATCGEFSSRSLESLWSFSQEAFAKFFQTSGVQSWSFLVVRYPLCDACRSSLMIYQHAWYIHCGLVFQYLYFTCRILLILTLLKLKCTLNGVTFYFYFYFFLLRFLHSHSINANKVKIKTVSGEKKCSGFLKSSHHTHTEGIQTPFHSFFWPR